MQRPVHIAPHAPILRVDQVVVHRRCDRDLAPRFVPDRVVPQLGIGQQAECVGRRAARLGGHGQQRFFARRQDVRFLAEQVVEIMLVDGQILALEPLGDLVGGHAGQFRFEPRRRLAVPDREGPRAVAHGLRRGDSHVLVELQAGVYQKPIELDVQMVSQLENAQQRLGRPNGRALQAGQLVDLLSDLLVVLIPSLLGAVEVRQFPLVALGDLISFRRRCGLGGAGRRRRPCKHPPDCRSSQAPENAV